MIGASISVNRFVQLRELVDVFDGSCPGVVLVIASASSVAPLVALLISSIIIQPLYRFLPVVAGS